MIINEEENVTYLKMVDLIQEDETPVVHLVLNFQQVGARHAIPLITVLLLGHSVIMN